MNKFRQVKALKENDFVQRNNGRVLIIKEVKLMRDNMVKLTWAYTNEVEFIHGDFFAEIIEIGLTHNSHKE